MNPDTLRALNLAQNFVADLLYLAEHQPQLMRELSLKDFGELAAESFLAQLSQAVQPPEALRAETAALRAGLEAGLRREPMPRFWSALDEPYVRH